MKRILPILLVLLILLALPAHAASGKLSAKADASGDAVTVTVRLDNPGIIATRIFVRYDSKALQLKRAENGDVFPQSNATFGRDVSSNPYIILWDQSTRRDNNTTSGTLCTLTFDVVGGTADGKTNVKIAVDKASTFDVDLNAVTVADGSCDVSVPVVTTKADATTTTTTKAPAPKPSAETTAGTTVKASDPTTAKPAQTTKPTLPKPTTTVPNTAGTPGQTTKAFAASTAAASTTAAAAADTPSTASSGTTSGAAKPDGTNPTAPDGTADPAAGETIPDLLTSGSAAETVSETQAGALIDPEPPTANRRNLLWLLLLIPAAAAIVLVVRKKKA